MSFYTHRDVSLSLNGNTLFCNSLSLEQAASFSRPLTEGENASEKNMSNGPVRNQLNINYWLTGRDFIKDYIYSKSDAPLSGNMNGINFSQVFLESYQLNAEANQPININASFIICDEVSGNFSSITPSHLPTNVKFLNFNDSTFNTFGSYSAFSIDNIIGFNWSYRAEVEPIYFQRETGESHLNPDRISINNKTIAAEITSDNTRLALPFTGENFALELVCNHPSLSISEKYGISGKIERKNFNVSPNDFSKSNYSITQSHLNQKPKIDSIDTSTYPDSGYILIHSLNNTTNGFLSEINRKPLIEKVILGGQELRFGIAGDISYVTVINNKNNIVSFQVGQDIFSIEQTALVDPYSSGRLQTFNSYLFATDFEDTSPFATYDASGNFFVGRLSVTGGSFTVEAVATSPFDTITGFLDNHSVNGLLQIQSTNGIITYPTPLTLNFPNITISGFNQYTGNFGDLITISGSNFNKIDSVLFNGMKSNFGVSKNNTGDIHTLYASVPNNSEAGYITIVSSLRNRSGISSQLFYPQGLIYGFNPVTGVWGGTITVSGLNFSGVSGLYFNGIKSPSFKVINNYLLTGQIPLQNSGYTKGYITLSGINGTSQSYGIYKPYFPVTGVSAISGTSENDMTIFCSYVDTGFLCPVGNNGFKVAFGLNDTTFYKKDNYALTGLIPTGYFDGQKIFVYEPDGVGRYIPYTGRIQQVGPAPIISRLLTPSQFNLYNQLTFNIEGSNFKDFFGANAGVTLRGRDTVINYQPSQLFTNSFYDKLSITGVVITGLTGYYELVVRNFVGSGVYTGIKVIPSINLANLYGRASQSTTLYSAGQAIDKKYLSHSSTNQINVDRDQWWKVTFTGSRTIKYVRLVQSYVPEVVFSGAGVNFGSTTSGYVELYNTSLQCIHGYLTGVSLPDYILNRYSNPITGVREIRVYGTLPDPMVYPYYTLALGEVEVF